MKFGYFCNTTNWNKKPYDQILEEAREITTYCDSNNWNSIWYTEHHFNHEGMESCTNPIIMGVDAAEEQSKLELDKRVTLLLSIIQFVLLKILLY